MAEFDETVIVMNNVSTKKTKTVATNVTNTALTNCHSKKVREYCILHRGLLAIMLLLIITIVFYHCVKHKGII